MIFFGKPVPTFPDHALVWKFLEFAGAEIMRRAVEVLRQAVALRRVNDRWWI
jgi:hypothetical protein